MTINENKLRRSATGSALQRGTKAGYLALCCAPLALLGCSTNEVAHGDESVGVSTQAVEGASCGYSLAVDVKKAGKKGFHAKLKIARADGGPLAPATSFSVLVNAGAAALVKVGHGTFSAVENGYLLGSVNEAESEDDFEDDDRSDPDVLGGKAYRFNLKFEGAYSALVANLISTSGVNCDQTAPSVQLTTSGDFFTSSGTLTLNATATDNVAVSKVVFSQDGVAIGTDTTAPYTLAVPITSALNGRHRYTATAYDLTGNQASETQRALIAIGNKFFGTATTTAADYAGLLAHFNQVTPGNAGKWGSVEAVRDQMVWTELDTAHDFAKQNHLPFKLHTLVWGQQQPSWLANLPPEQQLAEIEQWMSALAERYPDVQLIDVVNEPLHAPPAYAAALGGAGVTGWDWVVTAFEMARSHFPNAELLLNDYSIFTQASTTADYLKIVKLLKDRGLIDGIGEQGHFYERAPELSVIQANLSALQATGLPLYISELDLNFADDAQQANRMRDLFTLFWTNPAVLGITHWGYLQNNVWQPNIYLVRTDGSLRPALTWIDCFRAGGTNCTVPPYVPQPHTGTASGITLQAEEYDSAHDLLPAGNVVAYANHGSWFGYSKVVYQTPWNSLEVAYANGGTSTVNLTFHLDSLSNAPVATVALAPTGSWGTTKTVSVPWAPLGVQKDLFVKFNGGGANVDSVKFLAPPPPTRNIVANGTFETGTSAWYTWNTGVLAASTARAHGGAQSLLVNRTDNAPAATDITSGVAAGKSYPFSLWTSSPGTAQSLNVTMALGCRAANGTVSTDYNWIANPTTVPADGTWTRLSGTITIPSSCTVAQVQIYVEGGSTNFYVDDVEVLDSSAPNLITDGTFENGQGGWYGWNQQSLSIDTTQSHGGAKSLKGTAMATGAIARDIKALVTPGAKYTATAYARVTTASALKFQLVQRCNGATSDSYPVVQWLDSPAVGSWVQLTGLVDVSACTSIENLALFVGKDDGDLYIDDVSLTRNP